MSYKKYFKGFLNEGDEMKAKNILIAYPVHRAFMTPIKNLSTILGEFSEKGVVLITSNEDSGEQIRYGNISHHITSKIYQNIFLRVFNFIMTEIKISFLLFKISKSDDTVIYFMQNFPILPMFLSKILKLHILWMLPSSVTIDKWKSRSDPLAIIPVLFQNIGFHISDIIIVYSPLLIKDWALEKYSRKIKIAHEHFIDFSTFRMTRQLSERANMIGYIGRMNFEKGFENFLDSIPPILESDNNMKILIVGDGPLKHMILKKISKAQMENNVIIKNWIPHDDLPSVYNNLKLLIIPSHTEGLPNVLLEAMACGTPVLATPVGAIPDIIKDGETGFIMKDNSPVCIAENIIRVIEYQNLEKIAINAKKMVEIEFTLESTVKQWKRIFKET